jgi:hypothetical protein
MDKSTRWPVILTSVLILSIVVGGLFYYKWTGSWSTFQKVESQGKFTPRPDAFSTDGVAPVFVPFVKTLNYLLIVWPALAFGVAIAGAVRAFVSPRHLAKIFGSGSVRQQIVAGFASTPLMLCSCCVAPIFTSVYERSRRLGPSLAVMVGSPALNIAALALTFLLFPQEAAVARVAMAVVMVFVVTAIIGRMFRSTDSQDSMDEEGTCARFQAPTTFGESLKVFALSLGSVALRSVPVIILGVLLSTLIVGLFPTSFEHDWLGKLLMISLIALLTVPIALPTFFEIPLALALLGMGAPLGAAVAVLFAGPVINMPSLLTVARQTSWKVAVAVGVSVWAIAVTGGMIVG